LTPEGGDVNLTKAIVTRLADTKLVITSQNPETKETEVEVAHEALIRHWGKLQVWIADARVTARLVERVRDNAGQYYASQANPDNLTLRGSVLVEAETLLKAKPPRLTPAEAAFVRLCRSKENEEKDRELKNANARAEDARIAAEKQRRRTYLAGVVAAIAIGFLGLALWFQKQARDKTIELASELEESSRRLDLAKLREADVAWEKNSLANAHGFLNDVTESRRCLVWHYLNRKFDGALFALHGHTGPVTSVAVSPDGQRVVTGSWDTTARVWDARTGQSLVELKGHTDVVTSVAVSPDGQRVVTGSRDTTARVWDARTGQSLAELKGHTNVVTSVAVSPDGQRVVTGSEDTTARVWDARTGQSLAELKGHTGWVTSVAVSPDGQRVVTGSEDTTARVWDARTGQSLVELKGHTDPVTSVAVSLDGQRVVTRRPDGVALVWDVTTGTPLPNTPVPTVQEPQVTTPDGEFLFYSKYNRVLRIPLTLSEAERQERFGRTRSRPDLHREMWRRFEQEGNRFAAAMHRSLEQRALAQELIDRGLVQEAVWYLVAAEVRRPRPEPLPQPSQKPRPEENTKGKK
jgi:hypothetical protein